MKCENVDFFLYHMFIHYLFFVFAWLHSGQRPRNIRKLILMQKQLNYVVLYILIISFKVDHNLAKKLFLMNKNNNFNFIIIFFVIGNLELNDSCGLTEQCIQPFSLCFNGTCKCINGFSPFDTDYFFKGL